MPTKPITQRKISAYGMIVEVFQPGAFYQGITPGGFSDSLTGIHIPGPKAILDGEIKRNIERLIELPEPVQLPHTKIIIDISDSGKQRKEIEVDFNAADEQPMHEVFQQALSTGIIRIVPDDVMAEKYPDTWARRREHYVWFTEGVKKPKDFKELLQEAEDRDDLARFASATTTQIKSAQQHLEEDLRGRHSESEPPKPPIPPVPPVPRRN